MGMTVDSFVLYYQMVMVIILGIVALYIITYAFRGGCSDYGALCGIFYVYLNSVAGATRWSYGATTYACRGGASSSSVYCGAFYVNVSFTFSNVLWAFGATLFYF